MSRSRFTLAYDHHNMVPATAGGATPKVIFKSEDGILLCYGTTVPSDAAEGYSQGCIFLHVDGAAGQTLYINEGDDSSCDFNVVGAEDSLEALLQTQDSLAVALRSQTKGLEAAYPHSTAADDSGLSPLLWDGAPIEEVIMNPGKGFYYFEDFHCFDPTTGCGIVITQTSSNGTVANDASLNAGVLDIDTEASSDTDGPTVQFTGLQVTPAAGTHIYLEFRLKISDDQGNICFGLADDSVTTYHDGANVITNKDHALFFRDDDVTDADLGAQACDGTNTTTEDDVCDDVDKTAFENFGIHIFGNGDTAGDYVKFYHKGALVKTITDADGGGDDGVPDGIMCPVIQVNVDDNTTQTHIYLDWMAMLVYNETSGTVRE